MRRIARIRPDYEAGTKLCPDCQTEKGIEEFPVRKSGTLYTYCKECNARRAREWSGRNKDRKSQTNAKWHERNSDRVKAKARDNHYRRRYGLTREDIKTKLILQSSGCAICDKVLTEETLVVDHCHDAGTVRGLLCNLCNISLAPLERAGWLHKAIAYLERYRSGG